MIGAPILELSESTIGALKVAGIAAGGAAAAFGFFGRRFGVLDYRPGGTAFGLDVLPILAIGLALAVVVAFWWELVGGVLAAFIGASLAVFAINQLVAWHAGALILAYAVPAALWVLIDLAQLQPRRAIIGLVAVGIATMAGGVVGQIIYSTIWGPTHPEASVTELPESPVRWVWSGGVTTTSAEVRALAERPDARIQLELSTDRDFAEADRHEPSRIDPSAVVGFALDDLSPATEYSYRLLVDGTPDRVQTGRFTTFPAGPASFTVAVGACARVGSNGQVFETIAALDPLLYLIVGDFHYGDNNRDDIQRFREVMDLTLTRPAQNQLYRSLPIAYVWDDHDYAGNDSGGRSRARAAAMSAYREYVPSYELAGVDSAVYQALTIGRVRFVLTDARSARNIDPIPGTDQFSMLGDAQRQWLMDELVDSSMTHRLVVWVNPVPWIGDAKTAEDGWGSYAAERRIIADHIAENEISNLVMVSGDAHMVAIDDGTNTDYSTDGGAAFPLLHAAALDRPGGVKGGPYSLGTEPGGGQFGTIDVHDDGEEFTVTLTGRNWRNETLMTLTVPGVQLDR